MNTIRNIHMYDHYLFLFLFYSRNMPVLLYNNNYTPNPEESLGYHRKKPADAE